MNLIDFTTQLMQIKRINENKWKGYKLLGFDVFVQKNSKYYVFFLFSWNLLNKVIYEKKNETKYLMLKHL